MKSWIVDQSHSTVGFEVRHMMVSKVRGQFDSFKADIMADDLTDLTTAKIIFKFDGASINTRNRERDKHLKSVDFFDIENYPTIEFKSTNITKNRDNYKVTGDLKIKEITRPVTFDVQFGGKATTPQEEVVYGYEAEATINREEFGLTWNAALETGGVLVGKTVTIKVELELTQPNRVFPNTTNIEKESLVENNNIEHETVSNDIHRVITDNLTDLITIIDKNGSIQYVNPSFTSVLNYELHSLQMGNFFDIIHQDDQINVKNDIVSYSERTIKRTLKSEFRLLHKEGYDVAVEANIASVTDHSISNNQNEFILIVMRDISDRKEAEEAIYHLAFHDSLTTLPNRRSFINQLRSELIDRKYSKSKLSVFFIDLDNFKQINDQWGHEAGDLVLKEAARRIQSVISPTDVAARFGGDEFVVMLKDIQNEDDAVNIVQEMLAQFQNPIIESGLEHILTCSIGVANYPDHGNSPEDLIKNADTALYKVKEHGKNDFLIFNLMMEHQSLERRLLENALRQGIKEEQFFLEYQPKVNMATDELMGMEALVRWDHPDLGIIPPGKFIPLAEETGLIVPLGEWILKESCRQASIWQEKGYPPIILSVNVSVRQLEDTDFVDKVKSALHETGLDPKWLELEITESVLADFKSTVSILMEIQKLGIHISVDDFGTGYSSLNYIKQLPINTLKLDQSFVKDIHMNKESKEIAKAILNLAFSIGLNVIAEGVELKEHVDILSEDGFVLGQGYFYSRPLKASAFEEYMAADHIAS